MAHHKHTNITIKNILNTVTLHYRTFCFSYPLLACETSSPRPADRVRAFIRRPFYNDLGHHPYAIGTTSN